MADLKNLKELNRATKIIAKQFNEDQIKLGKIILEIDQKKHWWELGCSSLYNYCETYLKLCPEEVDDILEVTEKAMASN
jgi:hypothetical protein